MTTELRSPICCVLGHVDVGKTSLLDKLRKTMVAENESGGITQILSGWNLWRENIDHYLQKYPKYKFSNKKIPGLLIIDTPGHDSFNKFRSSGVNLCDIALLVVDITKGIQKTTLESIDLLMETKTPFVVVLNKIDKINGWVSNNDDDCFLTNLKKQSDNAKNEYKKYINEIISHFPIRNNWGMCKECRTYINNNIAQIRDYYCTHKKDKKNIRPCRNCSYYCKKTVKKGSYYVTKDDIIDINYCKKCIIKVQKAEDEYNNFTCEICDKKTINELFDIWIEKNRCNHCYIDMKVHHSNYNMKKSITMVPISSKTGEGLPDLLGILFKICEGYISDKLIKTDVLTGIVIEKNVMLKGFGSGYQVIVLNGKISKDDDVYVHTVRGNNKYNIKYTFDKSIQTDIYGCRTGEIIFNNPIDNYIYPGSIIKSTPEETKVNEMKIDIKLFNDICPRKPYIPYKYFKESDEQFKKKIDTYNKSLEIYNYAIKAYRVWIHAPNLGSLQALYNLLTQKGVYISGYSWGNTIKKKDAIKMNHYFDDNILPIVANLGSTMTTDVRKYLESTDIELITEPVIYTLVDLIISNKPRDNHLFISD